MTKYSKLGVIIVHYGSTSDTLELLESLNTQSHKNFTVYLVDNDPRNPLPKLNAPKYAYPIKLLVMRKNLGWPGGASVGAHYAYTDHCNIITFMTSDLVAFQRDYLKLMVRPIENDPFTVTLPCVVYDSNRNKLWMAGGSVKEWTLFTSHNHANELRETITEFTKPRYGGIGLTASAKLLNSVVYWSRIYFLYYEDVDICYKLQNIKAKIKLEPQAVISHKVSAIAERTEKQLEPLSAYCYARGAFIFMNIHFDSLLKKITGTLGQILIRAPLFIGGMILHKNYRCIPAFVVGFFDGFRILLRLATVKDTIQNMESFR